MVDVLVTVSMASKKSTKKEIKSHYGILFSLAFKQPWLRDQQDALLELIDVCNNQEERTLVIDLISRIMYLSGDKLGEYLNEIVTQIFDVWKINNESTVIACAAFDDDPDSSHTIGQWLKPMLARRGVDIRIVNTVNKLPRYYPKCKTVIIIDEFIGTGVTLSGRIHTIRESHRYKLLELEKKGESVDKSLNIMVCSLACMKQAKLVIEGLGVNLYSKVWLDKGISDYYRGENVYRMVATMKRIEACLDQKTPLSEDFHSMGYNGSEALYYMDLGNTPNNVFPVFWWPLLAGGVKRRTIMHRSMSPTAKKR